MSSRTSNLLLAFSVCMILLLSALYWERVLHSAVTNVPPGKPPVMIGVLLITRANGIDEDYQVWNSVDHEPHWPSGPATLNFWDESVKKMRRIPIHSDDQYTFTFVDRSRSMRSR